MSEFRVEVVRLDKVERHPNADALDVTQVHGGYPCVVRRGEFREGDPAVYVMLDALLPVADPRFAFLASRGTRAYFGDGIEYHRLRPARLRGTFSMGLLVPPEAGWVEGQDVQEALGIRRYEPPEPLDGQEDDEKDPGILPVYDVEGLRRWPDVLQPDEQVAITEKLDGENGRFVWHENRLWVASRTRFKKLDSATSWTNVARRLGFAERLRDCPYALYGEVYGGGAQGRHYNVQRGLRELAVFDVLDVATRRWLSYGEASALVADLGLRRVPELYRCPWPGFEAARAYAEGPTTLGGGHEREGFVVRPLVERFDPRCGRVCFKLHGEGALLRGIRGGLNYNARPVGTQA